MNRTEKLTKILFAVFLMVFSITVLSCKIPESAYVQESLASLEKSQATIMKFSGTTLSTSLAMSALPTDFATPLATTVSDLNTYFVFMFAVIFVEKLIVIEGSGLALTYIIPAACLLYLFFVLTSWETLKKFATKLLILGISIVMVIPLSTHFTETVCQDYLLYVDETIAEANEGSDKINDVMSLDEEGSNLFDKLSDAFKTALQGASDLLTYFNNVIKKCVNSVAIMLVTTFVLPLLILLIFRWLLKELFSLNIAFPKIRIRLPQLNREDNDDASDDEHLLPGEDEA